MSFNKNTYKSRRKKTVKKVYSLLKQLIKLKKEEKSYRKQTIKISCKLYCDKHIFDMSKKLRKMS